MQTEELSYAIVTPYSMRKSRTGGILARLISRTGLDLVAARMFVPSRPGSDASRLGRPDVFVELQLQPRRHVVGENPFGQRLWVERAVDRREEHCGAARREVG